MNRGSQGAVARHRCAARTGRRRSARPGASGLATLALAFGLGACAGGSTGPAAGPAPTPEPAPDVEYRGVPGFDTRDYPGDGIMARWLEHSPYRWVGYYLPAPCYTGTSWVGRRQTLRSMGWGVAVIYVGEQDWQAMGRAPAAGEAVMPGAPRCSTENVTAQHGQEHGADAARTAAGEGFPAGTAIYLDVERVDTVRDALAEYVRAWTRALLDDGRFLPALYAHERNAERLLAVMREVANEQGAAAPRLWVASGSGFAIHRAPQESGFSDATVWQGVFDTDERWGDVTLNIDANVSSIPSPSD